ncbi:hypothetical protein PtA15_1A145 [Puccinia triticina]|uniref:Uncharacterized protein n=1 Tax=Puccinia triticina TaxID=208348 RepID=A0ABY7CA62_9BASI|nr:uncharacterized protein PtA15_1A145 [Puccinia triticina]WAQ80807.1 hypothetical protein PtA15_1A145 [Puccinia triticina]
MDISQEHLKPPQRSSYRPWITASVDGLHLPSTQTKVSGAAPRDELARNDPGGPDAQGPVQSLKIRIRRPATTAPAAEISPMKGVQLTLAPAPDEFSASNPAPAVRFAPEKRGRPPRKVPAASLDISASSLAPAVQFAPAKRARPSEAISSSDAPAATFDNPPAKRIRPNKVEAASQPVAQASLVGILPAKRKVGRPKKAAQVNTSYTFRPEPLNSADWERTQARSQAYWKDHCTDKGGGPGLTPNPTRPAAPPPPAPTLQDKCFRPIKRRPTEPSTANQDSANQDSAAHEELLLGSTAASKLLLGSTAASKVVAYWKNSQAPAANVKAKRAGRKNRGKA